VSSPNHPRRTLLALAGSALLGLPRVATAAPVKRVGIIGIKRGGVFEYWKKDFPKEFATLGWTDGRNLELVWFDVAGDDSKGAFNTTLARERGIKRAEEMAAAGLDCLVANGEPHARMLFNATKTVPIVADVPDPVGNGFVRNLAHPGGNMTGLHGGQEEIAVKTVELLHRLMPASTCMAWIGLENFAPSAVSYENAARRVGLGYRTILIKSESVDLRELRAQMLALRRQGCQMAMALPLTQETADVVTEFALEHRMALSSFQARKTGFLLHYAARRTGEQENSRRIPYMVARILRGERPGDIPWEGPNRYELAINLKTAQRLGITVPADVLILADEIVR
jgi:putative ABC transport system substrate-binding protein